MNLNLKTGSLICYSVLLLAACGDSASDGKNSKVETANNKTEMAQPGNASNWSALLSERDLSSPEPLNHRLNIAGISGGDELPAAISMLEAKGYEPDSFGLVSRGLSFEQMVLQAQNKDPGAPKAIISLNAKKGDESIRIGFQPMPDGSPERVSVIQYSHKGTSFDRLLEPAKAKYGDPSKYTFNPGYLAEWGTALPNRMATCTPSSESICLTLRSTNLMLQGGPGYVSNINTLVKEALPDAETTF